MRRDVDVDRAPLWQGLSAHAGARGRVGDSDATDPHPGRPARAEATPRRRLPISIRHSVRKNAKSPGGRSRSRRSGGQRSVIRSAAVGGKQSACEWLRSGEGKPERVASSGAADGQKYRPGSGQVKRDAPRGGVDRPCHSEIAVGVARLITCRREPFNRAGASIERLNARIERVQPLLAPTAPGVASERRLPTGGRPTAHAAASRFFADLIGGRSARSLRRRR